MPKIDVASVPNPTASTKSAWPSTVYSPAATGPQPHPLRSPDSLARLAAVPWMSRAEPMP